VWERENKKIMKLVFQNGRKTKDVGKKWRVGRMNKKAR